MSTRSMSSRSSPAGRQSSRNAHWAQRRLTWSMLMAALAAGIAITPFSRRQSIARPGAIRLGIDAENVHFRGPKNIKAGGVDRTPLRNDNDSRFLSQLLQQRASQ